MTSRRDLLLIVSGLILLVAGSPLRAATLIQPEPPALVARGAGPTVVLLSGLLGGTARLEPLADQLVANGFRVVSIDPYRLAADAPDVSFHGLAQTVAAALRREGVRSAIVVAHAHASGVALRLAANCSELVESLVLLDAGVMSSTRSAGVARAMRVASLVSRLPGGESLIRSRLVAGIRENSGDARWVSESVGRAYADPLIEELPSVAGMASRLAAAREPEPVGDVLARLHTEVTALVGAAPHGFAVAEQELSLLKQIPGSRVRHIAGVGHFVHEEAAHVVVAEVLAAQTRRSIAAR